MAIRISQLDSKSARALVFNRIKAEQTKQNPKDRKITTWEVKGTAEKYTLAHTSGTWGKCGHFEPFIDNETSFRLSLRVADDHFWVSDEWPTLVGSLHGDLIQLLVNHFPEFTSKDSAAAVSVTKGWLNVLEKK